MTENAPRKRAPRKGEGRPTKYKREFCAKVEAEMARGFSLTAFAGLIGVSRSTIDEWMKANPEFSEAVTRAKAKRLLHWERAAMRFAKTGGGPGTATIIVFGLKNMGGDEWQDKQALEHSGPGGGPIPVQRVERVIVDPSNSDS